MATIPFVVIGGIIAARTLYQFGGDTVREFFDRIANVFKSLLAFVVPSFREGTSYTNQKLKEIDRDEKAQENNKDAPETNQKDKENPDKEKSKEYKPDINPTTISKFVPSVWTQFSDKDKMNAVVDLVEDISKEMKIVNVSEIKFGDIGENQIAVTKDEDNHYTITFDKNFCFNQSEQTSIDLYCSITKELAIIRQNEVSLGMVQPTPEEKMIKDIVEFNQSNSPVSIQAKTTFFLNEKIKPLNGVGNSSITADETSTFERRAIAMLQPCERIPNKIMSNYFNVLRIEMAKHTMSDEVKSVVKSYQDMSYLNIKEKLNDLYGCRNIEKEIDNTMRKNMPLSQNSAEIKTHPQVAFAVNLYQLQTKAEMNGKIVDDPRDKILEKINGVIPQMTEKQWQWNKGRVMYEGIRVDEIVTENGQKVEPKDNPQPSPAPTSEPKPEPKPKTEPQENMEQSEPHSSFEDIKPQTFTGEEASEIFGADFLGEMVTPEQETKEDLNQDYEGEDISEEETAELLGQIEGEDIPPVDIIGDDYYEELAEQVMRNEQDEPEI